MGVLFRPRHNTYFRIAIWCAVSAPLGITLAATAFSHSQFNTHVGEPIAQEVPFSHRHHAFELGIDCRYCHTQVETSAFAGIPPTKTCMTCHSAVWTESPLLKPVRESWKTGTPLVWNRVNDVPKFVYFDHSIHIARGINCNDCHGPVQDMRMTARGREFAMVWCLDCHRNPERYLPANPTNSVFDLYWKLQRRQPLTSYEAHLAEGSSLAKSDDPKPADWAKLHGIKVAELSDCTVCHR